MRDAIHSLLNEERVYIAAVGASEASKIHWSKWIDFCFFYIFDPNVHIPSVENSSTNFEVGLWSHKSSQILHLAAYPPSSSLFQSNSSFLNSFPASDLMQGVATKRISLQTLDQTLAGRPSLDFLKIDAEGAELEILKGAIQTLSTHCLGLQLKVPFTPLRNNAPSFNEIDFFVKSFDFELFHIQREHWFRKKSSHSFECAPQVIGGNVLYLLPKKILLKKIKESAHPKALFGKYLVILLAYQLFDYASELCGEVAFPEAQKIQEFLNQKVSHKKELFSLVLSVLTGGAKYCTSFSKKSKAHNLCYLRRKSRELGRLFLYLGRNGFALYD